ncbi:EpsG family protein [Parabacteroides distasonis]|jgi:hypothetical protein|uniref:EpsG family protein n=1 Tax=Parabacteroides distasonis TaxID=823 RepID=A0A7L5E9Q2_PARDI|nr:MULTISPECIES: EpsG family protein [Parabacteroides]MCC2781431.1 EpsG family protein [Parabacteroides distasonis]MCQ5180956.1 EpsG family protein [Parabacteroides distasonis]QJE28156.1 EpsG family protein [Parabacteroides distasonis]RLT70521.1 EpsG family protein [Parabacteroides sp. CH2-D42-20]WMI43429.1 EpsG family protein [Parabacteroides distasonis]
MDIYYFLFLWIAFLSSLDFFPLPQKIKMIGSSLLLLTVILFCGLRGDVDNDYSTYVGHWGTTPIWQEESVKSLFEKINGHLLEFGYVFICSLFKSIGLGYQSIFLFCSFLTFTLFYKSAKQFTSYPNFALFIFFSQFIMMPFMQIRYGVAMTCTLYAIVNWANGNRRKCVVYIILGILFHRLVWGCLLLIWLLNASFRFVVFFMLCALFIPFGTIEDIILGIFSISSFKHYMDYMDKGESANMLSILWYSILVYPYLEKIWRERNRASVKEIVLLKMYLISLLAFYLASDYSILSRISGVFSLSICFILPAYYQMLKKDGLHLLVYFFCVSFYCFLKYLPCLKYFKDYTINYNLF